MPFCRLEGKWDLNEAAPYLEEWEEQQARFVFTIRIHRLLRLREGNMDYELSEEQKLIQETAYKFAVNEIEPIAKDCDREERYPRDVWKKACETGLVGAFIPEEYGGPGFGFVELALITEQLSRIDLGIGTVIITATFGSENIFMFGTEEQKKKYLPLLANGEAVSAGAYTEPDAGTDVAATRTKAVRDGNEYVML